MFGELAALEEHRRALRDRIVGTAVRLPARQPAGRGRAGGAGAGLRDVAGAALVAGTRDALYLPGRRPRRVPWEQVEAADWDREAEVLRVREVGTWGEPRPAYSLALDRARPAARAGPRAGHRHRRAPAPRADRRAGAACG